ncbi:MAG: DMT family transporter [Thiobacillaceae bacterium]
MASAWMLVAGLSFALMGVWVKLAAQWFSSQELVFYRSAFGLLLVLGGLAAQGGLNGLRGVCGPHLALHLRRGVVGFAALATYFYSLTLLPMSVAITLNYTSPLFLTLLLPYTLGERMRPAQYAAVILGFAGVTLLLRPWEAEGDLVAGLIGLTSGFLAGLAYVHVRALGRLDEPEWRTVFWFAAVSSLGGALLASLRGWQPEVLPHADLLLLLGLTATLGQLAMTRAYRKGQTAVVAAFSFSTVVFGSLLDVLIWKEAIPATAWAGITLTVAAGVWAAILNARVEKTT